MNPRARLRAWEGLVAATTCSVVAALFLGPAAAASAAATGSADERTAPDAASLRAARERVDAKDHAGARALLEPLVARGRADGAAQELLGLVLERLGELDAAALRYELAAHAYGDDRSARGALAGLRRVDPLAARREAFERKLVVDLAGAAEELAAQGSGARALDLARRIAPLARDKDADRVRALAEKVKDATREVDLDAATSARPAGADWPLVERESKHYRLACRLEPELVARLGDVLDDLHAHYVRVYFDGDAKRARAEKATIRIVPDRKRLAELWQGGGEPPEGWWSPGTNEVVTYDVRSRKGELDEMLETLFHEASHQFTTLASGGGFVPAWLNEGTACFFEGTRAMADHRVLWPDAARGRLSTLVAALRTGGKPTARDVVSYASPASYPVDYYAYGWGLVYFLQEYEDERTLEHVYRPVYARYSTECVKRGADPMALFEELALGKASPLGHADFDAFERDWSKWITGVVAPLFGDGAAARKKRLERVTRYVDAAQAAHGDRKAVVSEEELLSRALGHVEYVRTRIDGDAKPDAELLLLQAGVLERLARPAAAAPLVEQVLDLADEGRCVLDAARYADLEKRLAKLDRRNAALRTARSRAAGLVRSARALLAEYVRTGDAGVARAAGFAAEVGAALDDRDGLLASASALRDRARALGRLHGAVRALSSPTERWTTPFSAPPTAFRAERDRVELETVRTHAVADPALELAGEYEVRARLVRTGAPDFGYAAGLVTVALEDGDWTMFGIDERGQAGQWTIARTGKTGATTNRVATWPLDPPLAEDETPEFAVRVLADGRVTLRVGARTPIDARSSTPATLARRVGVFVKNGRVEFADLVVESFP